MSTQPVLLFLHGVGPTPGDEWLDVLDAAVAGAGYPSLSSATVLAPKYADLLNGVAFVEKLPPVTLAPLKGEAARRRRREFDRYRTAVEKMLGSDDPGVVVPGAKKVAPPVVDRLPMLRQASNYVKDANVRAAVLSSILRSVPSAGRVCIVGHSLGSVIAADVLCRLPPDVTVSGLVTIGSPLAHEHLRPNGMTKLLAEPPSNLEWWANFWSVADLVPAWRGLSATFPWAIDRKIVNSAHPGTAHTAGAYLVHPRVAEVVGRGVFGSLSTALVPVGKSLDVPLDVTEAQVVLQLRYAHLVLQRLEGERRDRYVEAVRAVQARAVQQMMDRCAVEHRPVPFAVASLGVDLLDPASLVPEPEVPGELRQLDVVSALFDIATGNVVLPYEIDVPKSILKSAMEQLTQEMHLGSRFGSDVFDDLDAARKVVSSSTNWAKWAAIGFGAAALTAATGGLIWAAAPGVAGAAAVTSALASFGPGGMIGGLVTAGTLVGAGGGGIAGGIAYGMAAPGTSPEQVEAMVAAILAVAILRKRRGMPQDPRTWRELSTYADVFARAHSALSAVSDEKSSSLKELRQKLDAVSRALNYLEQQHLAPSPSAVAVTTA